MPLDEAGFVGALFADGGEMGGRIAGFDWSRTVLGPVDGWPTSLKVTVGVVLRSAVPMILLWGDDGIMLYNDAYSVFAGRRHPDLLGARVREGWPEVADFNDTVLREGLAGRRLAFRDQKLTLYRTGEAETVWLDLDYSPVPGDDGRPHGVLCVLQETTERIAAEQAVRERDELLRVAQDAGGVGAFEWYPETGRVTASDAFRRIWGFAADQDVTADLMLSLLHPDDFPLSGPARIGHGGNPLEYAEYRVRRPDTGEERWIARKGEIMAVGDGVPRYVGVAFDITERKRAAARFEGVFNSDLLGLTVFDTVTAETLAVNDCFLRMTGHTRAEFDQGRWDWREFTVPEYVPLDERAIAQARARGWWDPYEKDFRRRDGTVFPVRLASAMLPGEPGRVVVSIDDISARRAADAALRDSEARFRTLADAMPQLVWTADAEGRVDYCNRRRTEYRGLTQTAAGDFDLVSAVHPDDRDRTEAEWARSMASGEPYACEHRLARTDGGWAWHVSRATSARDATGRATRWYGTATDVDRLKRAEDALRTLNASLEQTVAERTAERDRVWRNSRDLLAVVDAAGVFQAINPAWTTILGHDPADVVGRSFRQFVVPDDAETTRLAVEVATTRDLTRFENRYRHTDGGFCWISWHTSVEGDLIYAYGRDVTADKAREAELALAQEALRQSQKLEAIGSLTGGVAHDFNNLLTPIVGSLDMLQRKGVGDERDQRLIGGAVQAAERAKTLIQRLLAFARRQPLQPTAVDLAGLVHGMAELIASTSGPQIRVAVEAADALPPARADANQLEMALLNLAVNARDAMPDGGTLRIGAVADDVMAGHRSGLRPGRYVRLSVADTGVGMDEATRQRAIEPFFSTKGVGQGTGLGLSSVHGLASQLGGAMAIESRSGVGTTIELWLPVSDAAVATAGLVAAATTTAGSGTALLVDDEPLVRLTTAGLLHELGYTVVEADSAEAALVRLRDGLAPSLVITDHLMPGMTGTDLAIAIRANYPGIRLLIVSGYADVAGIAPDVARITKPFRGDELAAAIAALG